MKVSFYTLGCKVNSYESEVMAEEFEKNGWEVVDFGKASDAVIVHTCAVTEESARKSRQIMRRAKRLCPSACVAVVGCLSQTNPETLSDFADIVLGSGEKKHIVALVERFLREKMQITAISDISSENKFENMILTRGEKTRAQVKIEDGCNNFCSYCIIPYARGRVRSKPLDDAVREITGLAQNGYSEIVLTGIHLDSYGKDDGSFGLLDLLEEIDNINGLERVRLSSLEPVFITEKNIERLKKLKTLCPHFHLSLQSGSSETLRRMNRHYTPEQFEHAAELLRENFDNVSITTDIIVGFPGETDEEFNESYSFAKKIAFAKIHVFPFSPRKGTRAFNMENQVPAQVKNERVHRMLALDNLLEEAFRNAQLGRDLSVLFEQIKGDNFVGYAENYVQVAAESDVSLVNVTRKVKITKIFNGICFGTIEK